MDTCRHLEQSGFDITYLPVKPNGLVDLDVFKANRGYYEWMMKGDFPENTKAVITKLALESRNA